MPFYATRDFDGERITRNADVRRFNTEAQAREYLLAPYANAGEWDIATAEIGPGSFSDCWIKTLDAPRVGTHWIAPFSYSQLYVQHPGEHPGGKMHWTTPTPDVLVVLGIKESETEPPLYTRAACDVTWIDWPTAAASRDAP